MDGIFQLWIKILPNGWKLKIKINFIMFWLMPKLSPKFGKYFLKWKKNGRFKLNPPSSTIPNLFQALQTSKPTKLGNFGGVSWQWHCGAPRSCYHHPPPPPLFIFSVFSSLSSSFCCCCHQVTMTTMMKTIGRKALCPSFFHVEIIIMSLAMMMIKGWRVSWMPIMLWSSFIWMILYDM